MNYDQVINQLEDHLLKAIDEGYDDFTCELCKDDDRVEQCADATVEATNLALIVLQRARGKVSVPEMMTSAHGAQEVAAHTHDWQTFNLEEGLEV